MWLRFIQCLCGIHNSDSRWKITSLGAHFSNSFTHKSNFMEISFGFTPNCKMLFASTFQNSYPVMVSTKVCNNMRTRDFITVISKIWFPSDLWNVFLKFFAFLLSKKVILHKFWKKLSCLEWYCIDRIRFHLSVLKKQNLLEHLYYLSSHKFPKNYDFISHFIVQEKLEKLCWKGSTINSFMDLCHIMVLII